MCLQAFSVGRLFWHYLIPVGVFVYCYARIFYTIRRQSKVVAGHSGHNQGTATVTTMSGNQTLGQVQQQGTAAAAAAGGKLSHTEINVLKTMITVIVVFVVFWSVTAIANFFQQFEVSVHERVVNIVSSQYTEIFLKSCCNLTDILNCIFLISYFSFAHNLITHRDYCELRMY